MLFYYTHKKIIFLQDFNDLLFNYLNYKDHIFFLIILFLILFQEYFILKIFDK